MTVAHPTLGSSVIKPEAPSHALVKASLHLTVQKQRDGILGIQPLVSTYLNCHWGGVFWVRSDLESRKKIRVLNLGGGSEESKPKVPRSA